MRAHGTLDLKNIVTISQVVGDFDSCIKPGIILFIGLVFTSSTRIAGMFAVSVDCLSWLNWECSFQVDWNVYCWSSDLLSIKLLLQALARTFSINSKNSWSWTCFFYFSPVNLQNKIELWKQDWNVDANLTDERPLACGLR